MAKAEGGTMLACDYCKKNERLMKLYKTELLVRIIELQKASKGIRRLRAKVKRLTLQKVAEIEEKR